MMKRLILLFAVFLLSGCAYSFVGQNNAAVGGIKAIYVENIENLTSQPNLQTYFKGDIINTLKLDSRLSVVDKQLADGFLKVKIINYSVNPVSFSQSGFASRYRCSIVAVFSLFDKDGKPVIDAKQIEESEDFDAKDKVLATEKAKNKISKDVLKSLALKLRDALFVNF